MRPSIPLVIIAFILIYATGIMAQDVIPLNPSEIEPDWNLRITPFADHNENGVMDEGEDFIPAAGSLTYTEVGGGRTWEASEGPALIQIPYGIVFTVQGEAEAYNVYECFSPHTYKMVDSGAARVDFACDPKNWFEFSYHLWVSFLTAE